MKKISNWLEFAKSHPLMFLFITGMSILIVGGIINYWIYYWQLSPEQRRREHEEAEREHISGDW